MMGTWFHTRCIMLPYCIYNVWVQGLKYTVFDRYVFPWCGVSMPIYCYLLSLLVILHYYWFSLFVKMLYIAITKGVTEDKQNDITKEKKEEK